MLSRIAAGSALWPSLMITAVNVWHLWRTSLSGARVARELDVIIVKRECKPKTIVSDSRHGVHEHGHT